jgi:hypothetical protein
LPRMITARIWVDVAVVKNNAESTRPPTDFVLLPTPMTNENALTFHFEFSGGFPRTRPMLGVRPPAEVRPLWTRTLWLTK